MQIRRMIATFGKLEQAELSLQPGLNVIYAPNESGKSTWSRFIRAMFYGVNTRDRGELADKNRYAPWSGAAMSGRMDLTVGQESYTLLRRTKRANAPMADFSCTYTDTADDVPDIREQTAGEQLLGVSRDVFERSAFISQMSLAVDQNAELERRIAALITTGEEETSYSETHERLKKQLNRRKYNQTGQIPMLEREIAALDGTLEEISLLREQRRAVTEQMELLRSQTQRLAAQKEQWALWQQRRQWEEYDASSAAADGARQRFEALKALSGPLPDEETLTRLEGARAARDAAGQQLDKARQEAADAITQQQAAQTAWQSHPLYPEDELSLRRRCEEPAPPPRSAAPWIACLILWLLLWAAAALMFTLGQTAFALAAGVCGAVFAAAALILRHKKRTYDHLRRSHAQQQARLSEQRDAYLSLMRHAAEAQSELQARQTVVRALEERLQGETDALLQRLSPYRPDLRPQEIGAALAQLRRQTEALSRAEQACRESAMQQELLRRHLPPERPSNVPAAPPEMPAGQIDEALVSAENAYQAAQSRLDTLTGQLRSLGDGESLSALRQEKAARLTLLQQEYDAISLAIDALDRANLTLQNRFSPALGARAAEIFSGITGGRYQKVLLSRDFSLAAEPAADSAMRSVRLLSQGTADQLYLAVRLAICDLVLPKENGVPLILDDALVSFDDRRLHAALDYLAQTAHERQILLFTCQRRESDYLAGRENVTLTQL